MFQRDRNQYTSRKVENGEEIREKSWNSRKVLGREKSFFLRARNVGDRIFGPWKWVNDERKQKELGKLWIPECLQKIRKSRQSDPKCFVLWHEIKRKIIENVANFRWLAPQARFLIARTTSAPLPWSLQLFKDENARKSLILRENAEKRARFFNFTRIVPFSTSFETLKLGVST